MIWGITLEPGQAHTQVIEDEVHLSMATMESRGCIGSKADNFSHVVIKTGTTEYLLCTLVNGITYQQCLDLKLMPSDKVTFSVQGTNVVYLTGYSFASSETEQEIIQTEDWIDNPVLEGDISQDNLAYAEDAGSFQPSEVQNEVQRQHQQTKGDEVDISDREKFSVEFEVPAEEEYQYIPERVHQQVTDGTPCTSSQGQPQDHHPPPGTVAGGSGVEIKEEIHTVVETEEDIITDQPIEDVPGQSGHQSIHQPSTSAGQNVSHGSGSSSLSQSCLGNTSMAPDLWQVSDGEGSSHDANSDYTTSLSSYNRGKSTDRFRQSSRLDNSRQLVPSTSYTPSHSGGTPRTHRVNSGNDPHRASVKTFYPTSAQRTSASYSSEITSPSVGNIPLREYDTLQPERHGGEQHQPVKPYQCRFCGRGFTLSSMAKKHERIHTGERPYCCQYCPKNFKVLDSLKKHERTHTGERPYVCDLCGKSYKQNSHLRCHQRTFHNVVCKRRRTKFL